MPTQHKSADKDSEVKSETLKLEMTREGKTYTRIFDIENLETLNIKVDEMHKSVTCMRNFAKVDKMLRDLDKSKARFKRGT